MEEDISVCQVEDSTTKIHRPPSATKSNHEQMQEQTEEQNDPVRHETQASTEMNIEVEQETVTTNQMEQAVNIERPPSATNLTMNSHKNNSNSKMSR